MARIYNSRQLLDPSMIQYVGNRADQNVAFENALRDRNTENIRNLLLQAGKTAKDYRQQNARENEVSVWDIPNDPIAKAAREEYIRTGNTSPLLQYQMAKRSEEQRKLDEANRKKSQDWHDKLSFMNNLKAYQDATDPRSREILKQTIKHDLEVHPEWGSPEQIDAMEQANIEKQEMDLNKKLTAEEDAKWQKEQDAKSYAKRIELETNMLPNAKNATDKSNYMKVVEQLYANGKINDADRKALEDEIRGTQTYGERSKKASEDTSINIESDEQKNKAAERKANKALADAGRKAIANGKRPTRAQQKAIDEGY